MTEARVIAVLVAIIGVVAFTGWGIVADFDAGKRAGSDAIQKLWDADKAAIQKTADDRIAQNTKDKEAALANNEGVINDLQTQLNGSRDLASTLSNRLRDAENRAAASSSALSKTSDQLRASTGALNASLEQINGAVADAINECGANNAKYTALVKQLKPQL